MENNIIDTAYIEQNTIVNKIFYLQKITSTQDWGKEFLRDSKTLLDRSPASEFLNGTSPESSQTSWTLPVLILAREQTAGRGRGNHQWWSPEGMLAMSLLVRWDYYHFSRINSTELSLRIAQNVVDTLNVLLQKEEIPNQGGARIVPPNDVYINDKKISGILIESPVPEFLVIGIGVNINNSTTSVPPELAGKVTTLSDRIGKKVDETYFLTILLNHLLN